MTTMRFAARSSAALFALLALVASACGGGSSTDAGAPAEAGSTAADSAAVAAAGNIDILEPNDDVRLLEVLDVTNGEPTTLASTVDGDRPVLLWFWAPH